MHSFYKTIIGVLNKGSENIALIDMNTGKSFSYKDLDLEVSKYADSLRQRLSGNGCVVLNMEKNYQFIIAQLAMSKLGKPFLPLDKKQINRNKDIISDINPEAVIFDISNISIYSEYTSIDKKCEYVIYSSGSTGKPKGILLKGEPAINIVSQQAEIIGIQKEEKYLWLLNTAFDASLSDIYSTFVSGATLVIPNFESTEVKKLVKAIIDYQINYIDLPPSMFRIFCNLTEKNNLNSLKTIVFGGETAGQSETHELAKKFKMVQAYGPTETTICSSMNIVDNMWISSDIGTPLEGVDYFIENNELLIAGDVICLGYFKNELLNKSRFVEKNGKLFYKTGDVVELINGKYIYKGRKDRQFKLHSQLICPEEIEAKAQLAGATFAHINYDEKMYLFYQGDLNRVNFESSIATYMIPNKYILLDGNIEQYLNANMKINHKALKELIK